MSSATHVHDQTGNAIEVGDKFIQNTTTNIYEVIGYTNDGRIRCKQALVNFGENPFAPSKLYGSTNHLVGPVYLFLPHQILINKEWTK